MWFRFRDSIGLASAVLGMITLALSTERPQELTAAAEARNKALLRTARIEYAERSIVVQPDGRRVERPLRYYTWRCADDAYVSVDHGDEEGVVMRDLEGRPRDDLPYHGAQQYLVKNDEVWLHVEQSPAADIFGNQRSDFFRLHDLRRLGLDPVAFGHDIEAECREHGLPAPEYETTIEDGLYVVTTAIGPGQIRWWIDPDRGWSVVRSAVSRDGQETSSTHFSLSQTEGVWFPQEIEHTRHTASGHTLTTVITILSTEFNRPEHPQELTPADIGVEPGMTLNYQDRDDVTQSVWDGQRPISPEEYTAALKDGSLKRGPTVERELARWLEEHQGRTQPQGTTKPSGGDAGATTRPARFGSVEDIAMFASEWEAYTRRFIMKHRLKPDQARKAWQVCRDCESRGRSYIEAQRSDLDDWQRRLEASRHVSAEEWEKQQGALDRRRTELVAPLQRIFEQRLKPELDKLPTPSQRETPQAAGS